MLRKYFMKYKYIMTTTTKIIIDDHKEEKETEEKFYERFMREFNRLPQGIQDAIIEKEIEEIMFKTDKEEIDELIKKATNRAEKARLKLKKKVLEKKISK
jgi:hypothetical protein